MPPRVKVTKEMVADASFEVIRRSGYESLNARAIAEYLGCSTQPVLYSFKTVDEIKEAAYEIADKYHSEFIMPKSDNNPMMELGLNYVRFGYEEKNLFRFLFQTDSFGDKNIGVLMSNPELSGIIDIMSKGLEVNISLAREMFLTFFCVAHGLASMLANNSMEYDEKQCKKMFENVFNGMVASKKGK